MDIANERGGNLYNPKTLQGNWYEDRAQQTVGSNDGLRCTDMAYNEMMANQIVYKGPVPEISMPATQYGNVSTQQRGVNLFTCTKYRHPLGLPTGRVVSSYIVNPDFHRITTSMLMTHGERRDYVGDPKKPMLDTTNMKEALRPRPTQAPEHGFGAILPRYQTDSELGTRYFETTTGHFFDDKSQKRFNASATRPPSSHPIAHPATVEEELKGAENETGAGFVYDPATAYNPMPFPSKGLDGGDPWGRKKVEKVGHFGKHHITSTCRLFNDMRGIDLPRLGITIPNDTTMWKRQAGMPEPKARQTLIAYTQKDNATRRNGIHIWDDYVGR